MKRSLISNTSPRAKELSNSRVKKTLALLVKTAVSAAVAGALLTADRDPIERVRGLVWLSEPYFEWELAETSIEHSLSQVERRNRLAERILPLVEQITVQKWDIPDRLVAKSGLSAKEFWVLNAFLGYGDGSSNQKIHPGDTFVMPIDTEGVREYLDSLTRIERAERLRSAIDSGKSIKELKKIVRTSPFPSEVECVGMAETTEAMILQQEQELDPEYASVVDPRIEHKASCANLIKYLYIHSCNLKHYSEAQRKMLLTEGLDAWILPKRLYSDFGYEQRFRELMDSFEFNRITAFDPINPKKKAEYQAKVREVFSAMESGALPNGTLVPLFFQYSKAKEKVAGAYVGVPLKDKHMNTHQTILVRNATMRFLAGEIPSIEEGKRIPFGEKSPHRKNLEMQLRGQNYLLEELKRNLLAQLTQEKNPELFANSNTERAQFRALFQKDVESGKALSKKLSDYGITIERNSKIQKEFTKILRLKKDMFVIEDELASYATFAKKIAEKRTLADVIVNFEINRADFNGSFSAEFKAKVLSGLRTYPEFFHVQVNGVSINMAEELAKISRWEWLIISPTDTITLSGPMMIDGEIQSTHRDPRRQKVMNARTRFAFEFFTTAYLPTEVAYPKEWAIKTRATMKTPASGLSFSKVYALKSGETIEQVLFEKIAEFEKISPEDSKRREKILKEYQVQIRWLMLDGFMRSENELNPSSTLPNRPIPYYNKASVSKVWPKYINSYYENKISEQERLGSDVLEFPIISGGGISTPKELFVRLSKRLEPSEKEYPILAKISSFNEFQKLLFIDRAYKSAKKDAKSPTVFTFFTTKEQNRTLFFSVSELVKIVEEISSLSTLATPKLRPIDEEIIDSVAENEQEAALLKNTLYIETYGGDAFIQKRQLLKWLTEKSRKSVGIYQIRLEDLEDADIVDGVLRAYRGKTTPEALSQPTRQDILNAIDVALSVDVLARAKEYFANDTTGMELLYRDAKHLRRVKEIFESQNASKLEVKEAYMLLRKVNRFDIMGDKPFLWKYFGTEFLRSKYRKHFENVTFWLQKIGIPFEELSSNEELRFQYERAIVFVNNQGEWTALLLFSTNYLLRILDALQVPANMDNVYIKPKTPWGVVHQQFANQIYFDRALYLEHFGKIVSTLSERIEIESRLAKMGDRSISPERLRLLTEVKAQLETYLQTIKTDPKKIHSTAIAIFSDKRIQQILQERNYSTTPFVTDAEVKSNWAFRASAFYYISKMMKAVSKSKDSPWERGFLQKLYSWKILDLLWDKRDKDAKTD